MRTRIVAAGCVLALLASGCGSRLEDDQLADGNDVGSGPATSAPAAPGGDGAMFGDMEAPCGPAPEGFTPTASDTGLSDDTIKIGVVSDRAGVAKVPTASIEETVRAFVGWCNDLGGINGRTLELSTYDALLFETHAAATAACNDGLFALVGSGTVFDHLGAKASVDCNMPDVAAYTATAQKTLAPNVVTPIPNPPASNMVGAAVKVAEFHPDAVAAAAMVSSSAVETAWVQAQRAVESWGSAGYDFVQVLDTGLIQESYAAEALRMKNAGVTMVTMVSETGEGLKLLRDMEAQSFAPEAVLFGAQYYDPVLLSDPASEGVYVELNTHPFEEADEVPAMQQYLDIYGAIGSDIQPTSLGVQSFSAALLFATAARNAGEGLTRETLMAELKKINSWDGGGLHYETNPGAMERGGCFVMVQVRNGAFQRVHPEEPGTFACDESNIQAVNDPALNGDNVQW